MRKIGKASIASAIVLGLLGAGITAAPAQAETITLTFGDWGDMGFKELFKKYEDLNPNIKIVEKSSEYNAHHQGLLTAIAAGTGNDINGIEGGWMPYFVQYPDKFLDLRNYGGAAIKKDYLSWRWNPAVAKNGTILGLPTDVGGMALAYRTDLRLERGNLDGASDSVLNAIARALQLDDIEVEYLFKLARSARTNKKPAKATSKTLRPNLELLLSTIESTPVFIRNNCTDILGVNALGRAMYSPVLTSRIARGNSARFVFLDPAAKDFYVDYQKIAEDMVGAMRLESVRSENDPNFMQLLGELTAKSELFQQLWPNHRLMRHAGGQKSFNHPEVGVMTLTYEPTTLVYDDSLFMTIYTAEPGSESAQKLALLGAWYASNPELQEQVAAVL